MAYDQEYTRKLGSAEAAAATVQSGDWVDYGFGLGQPDLFDRALAARRDALRGVRIRSALSLRPCAVSECDPGGEHFLWFSWHVSGLDRSLHDGGCCNYVPMNFGEGPDYYRRFVDRVDVACLKTCPMDEHGYFNFGGAVSYHKAVTERAKTLIVETCESMPYVYGSQEAVHISEVDHIIEGGAAPIPELGNPHATEIDHTVAGLIAAEIEDGACLRIGIGGMPNAVCTLLCESSVRDLGIHTEMLVDGMIDLWNAGKITGARKTINRYQMVFTFAAGSRRHVGTSAHQRRRRAIAVRPRRLRLTRRQVGHLSMTSRMHARVASSRRSRRGTSSPRRAPTSCTWSRSTAW